MDIKKIKKELPIGASKQIAKLSGLNISTVERFLAGYETKEHLKLLEITTQYLKEYKERKAKLTAELQAVAGA